jgi:hypothetical protein
MKQAARKVLLRWRNVRPKCQLTTNGLHVAISQKTELLVSVRVLSGLFTVAVNPPNAAKLSVLIAFLIG